MLNGSFVASGGLMAGDFDDIGQNPFYKIIFDEKMDADQKLEKTAECLSFGSRRGADENLSRLRDFQKFKDYVRSERQRIAKEIITRQVPVSDTSDVHATLSGTTNHFQNIYAIL